MHMAALLLLLFVFISHSTTHTHTRLYMRPMQCNRANTNDESRVCGSERWRLGLLLAFLVFLPFLVVAFFASCASIGHCIRRFSVLVCVCVECVCVCMCVGWTASLFVKRINVDYTKLTICCCLTPFTIFCCWPFSQFLVLATLSEKFQMAFTRNSN